MDYILVFHKVFKKTEIIYVNGISWSVTFWSEKRCVILSGLNCILKNII